MPLLHELMEHFGLGRADLERIIVTAPARYKVYQIDKRHGGVRTIAQPSQEVKAIQRYILDHKLNKFPVHSSAMGYVTGRSIRANAMVHIQATAILKLDFQSFFPSIKVGDWQRLARKARVDSIEGDDWPLYSKVLFWGEHRGSIIPRCLSIGAPTSPMLSNILMYEIDSALSVVAVESGVKYTRYADDITVSGDTLDAIRNFERRCIEIVRQTRSPNLTFNQEKRGVYLKGQRRMVTGLVITPTCKLSIGRKRKREILALLHKSTLGQLDARKRGYLKGMLGFSIANEPSFVARLRQKYGNQAVDEALRFHIPSRLAQELEV